ncbi:hypothetical protein [Streptomyces sp. NPDC021212]|uniref:hypothetical protein n=1 Tax=Streptomyces sp. NPDC021212 TaxID=3365118 RepID=UPI0037918E93
MPRRRPSALRGDIPIRFRFHPRRRFPHIDRLSGSCAADLCRLERRRFRPGAVDEAFWQWKALANRPLRRGVDPFSGCGIRGCCGDAEHFRELLETVIHALPKKSARELRALVWSLDARIVARLGILHVDAPDRLWWRGLMVGYG